MPKLRSAVVRLSRSSVVALGAVAMIVGLSAFSMRTVTFTPEAGGFAGKGDVQLTFGWDNRTFQANAYGVTFSYETAAQYEWTCTWEVGGVRNRRQQVQTHSRNFGVNVAVEVDVRSRRQITGFILSPIGAATSESGSVPVEGGACVGGSLESGDGVISDVQMVGGSSVGTLFAIHGGNKIPLMVGTPIV